MCLIPKIVLASRHVNWFILEKQKGCSTSGSIQFVRRRKALFKNFIQQMSHHIAVLEGGRFCCFTHLNCKDMSSSYTYWYRGNQLSDDPPEVTDKRNWRLRVHEGRQVWEYVKGGRPQNTSEKLGTKRFQRVFF